MKILFYAPDFAVGGAWTYLRLIVKGLHERSHTLTLVASKSPGIVEGLKQVKPYFESIYQIDPLRSVSEIKQYIAVLHQHDIVQFNFIKPNICYLPVLLARIFAPGTVRVGYNHLPIPPSSRYPIVEWFRKRLVELTFRLLDRVMIPTEDNIEEIQKYYNLPRDIFAEICYSINVDKFNISVDKIAIRKDLQVPENIKVISVVARLVPQKGLFNTVDAIDVLSRNRKDFVVLFVGEGELESSLRAEIQKRNLESYFKFLGYREDIPPIMHITDILLLTSLWESFGLVFVEANACGVPAIGPNIPGVRYAIAHGETGYLIDSKNPEQIAARLDELMSAPEKRHAMGRRGLERARKLFGLERLIQQTESLYSAMLKEKGGSIKK